MAVLMTAKEISDVIKGKVSRRYLSEQIYGMPEKD